MGVFSTLIKRFQPKYHCSILTYLKIDKKLFHLLEIILSCQGCQCQLEPLVKKKLMMMMVKVKKVLKVVCALLDDTIGPWIIVWSVQFAMNVQVMDQLVYPVEDLIEIQDSKCSFPLFMVEKSWYSLLKNICENICFKNSILSNTDVSHKPFLKTVQITFDLPKF